MNSHIQIRSASIRTGMLASLAAIVPCAGAPAQTAPVSVVAMSGDPLPAAGAGVTYTPTAANFAIGVPFMNNTGRVALLTGLAGTGVGAANDFAILCGLPGSISIVAREGDAAPDLPGLTLAALPETPLFGGDESVSFRALVAGTGVGILNDDVLCAGGPGSLVLAAREGGSAPGDPGATYASFTRAAVSQTATLAYGGNFGSGVQGLFYGIPGSITNFVRPIDATFPAPGFPPGVLYGTLDMTGQTPVLVNSAGQVVYRGTASGPGIGAANDDAIWGGTPGSTHLVARAGDAAPGGAGTYSTFLNPVLNDTGAVAFTAFLVGVPGTSDFAIFRTIILGVMDRVVTEGDPAPGTPGVFAALDNLAGNGNGVVRFNNAYGVAFRAGASGGGITAANDIGIWGHNDIGSLTLLLREGDGVAAAGAGVTVATIAAGAPALNGANRVAARVTLAGAGVTAANDEAVLARNGVGDLVVALREGASIEIPGSGTRTISTVPAAASVVGPGVQNGASTTWTDDCRLLFRSQISDGRVGVFIADVNATCRASITDQPDNQSVSPGDDATLTAVAAAGFIGGSYRWQRNGVDIVDGGGGAAPGGGVVSGASGFLGTPHDGSPVTLTILGAQAVDSGQFRVLFTNVCGEAASSEAGLTVAPPPCPGDANADGAVSFADVTSVLTNFGTSYAPGTGPGDANHDGVVNFADVTSVLTNFGVPCP